jgi:hypothetical protein
MGSPQEFVAEVGTTVDLLPRNLDQTKVDFSEYKTVRGEGA